MSTAQPVQANYSGTAELNTRVVSRILRGLGVKRLCLHGSRAKGTAHVNSDWDFFAEFSRPITRLEARQLKELLAKIFDSPVNVHAAIYSPADFIAAIQPHCIPIWPDPDAL